jgi:CheY-like chemotaxis protein
MNSQKTNLLHILLVEDSEGDILLTSEALEEYKVKTEISVAKNGQEALDFLFKRGAFMNEKTPDLILLDINIPIFNGHEVLQQIKTDSNLKKIPVIMLTTSSNPKDIAKANENNCNGYIKKPLEIEDFLSAILKIEQFCLELKILPN